MTGRKEGLEGLNSPYATLRNLGYSIPLVLKVSGLGIPLINFSGDRVKGHDLFHEGGGDSSSEEADEDVVGGGDLGWEVSYQLELSEMEIVMVCESITPVGKLDLLLCLVLDKGQV